MTTITARQQEVLALIAQAGPISRSAIAERLSISPNTAGVHITALRDMGLIDPTSFGRFSAWTVCAGMPKSKRRVGINRGRSAKAARVNSVFQLGQI